MVYVHCRSIHSSGFRLLRIGALAATLIGCSGGGGGGSAAPSAGTLQFAASTFSGVEGETVSINVTRAGGTNGTASVTCSSNGGTATAGQDYTAINTTLVWVNGDSASKTCNVTLSDDNIADPNETISIRLTNVSGAALGALATATVEIVDNDSAGSLQFSAVDYTVNEGGGAVTVSVTRSGGNDGSVSVDYATSDGTAQAGSDYTIQSGTLNWAHGDTAPKTFNIPITNDSATEASETIVLKLSNPLSGAALGSPASATVTIVDNDSGGPPPQPGSLQFSDASYSVNEATGSVTVTVARTGGSAGAVAVNYATTNGSAQAPTDYTAKSGTLSWTDGDSASKTFVVSVANDATPEGPETVQLTLSSPTGGAALGANASATLVIDDTPGTILFTQTSFTVLENAGTARVTVSRQGGSNGTVSVDFTTADAAPSCPDPTNQPETCEIASRRIAKPNLDYTPTAGTVTFLNGETSKDIEIPITFPDPNPPEATQQEPAETLDIALCQATGTNVGNQVRAVLTIADFQASANPGIVLSPTANNRPGSVPINMHPEITLSVLVDQASLTATTAKVRCDTGTGTVEIQSAQAIFDPEETTVTIVPQTNLPSTGATCFAVLTSGVRNPSGAPITTTELVSSSFTTGSTNDTAAPTVTNQLPTPGSTGVNPDTVVIGATINDYMLNTLSINPRNVQLSYSDGGVQRVVAATVNFVPDTDLPSGPTVALPVTLKPACPLRRNTQYTVTFKGAGVNKPIRDVTGNPLAADVAWSFTTAP